MIDGRSYGSALFSLAAEEGIKKEIYDELTVISDVLKDNKELFAILDTPALPLETRLGIIDSCFGAFHLYIVNMMKMLTEKFCSYLISDCIKAYSDCYDESENLLRATAISAYEMSEKQKSALKTKLSAATGKTVVLTNEIDEKLIGGVKLRYGGVQLDGSIKTKLEELRESLSKTIV